MKTWKENNLLRVRESEYDDEFFAELRRRHMDQLQQISANASKRSNKEEEESFYIDLENELVLRDIALDGTYDPEYDLEYLHISATKDEDGRIVFEAQGDSTVGYGHNYEELEKDILENVILDEMLYSDVKIKGKAKVKKEIDKILSENK